MMKTTNNTIVNQEKKTYLRPQMLVVLINSHSALLTVSATGDYDIIDGGAGADGEYGD